MCAGVSEVLSWSLLFRVYAHQSNSQPVHGIALRTERGKGAWYRVFGPPERPARGRDTTSYQEKRPWAH
jgi:hypothetical protein